MTDNKKPASAGTRAVRASKENKAVSIEARIVQMQAGEVSAPTLVFKGDELESGQAVTAKMPNGSVYAGVVDECSEVDGEIVATLAEGLTPVTR